MDLSWQPSNERHPLGLGQPGLGGFELKRADAGHDDRGLRPGTMYDVSAIFIGIDPKRREMRWGIDVGFSPEELAPFGIDSEGVTATGNVTATGTGIQVLAPVGKQAADARGEIQVYLNTSNYGPNSRTRYDGLGYKASKRP